ncbi:hypothetical protein D187_000534 [Cystobacter fuscus DSM 2262]|uniref:Phytol kinase n=1 Tax=Cystobacter fuscus (strain ATCC 25194 / DSM 2262 / NBRC 100088 / M29) TaxID=1242864 RepID=S9QUX5_CYSF2|nr:DUF92 domain-containing protein [Cystobacter fuscus]EPX65109.1 hypothetical protein D187_000534 [Cystobacter fuscus DSM 2262]
MMSQDLQALLLSYGYVGACVLVGEVAARRGVPRELARKFIHVGVGLWIFGILALFEHREWAVLPSLTAAVGNYVIHRKRLLQAVEAPADNLGTVWFALSFSALVWGAWDRPAVAVGGVLAMTIGDALASLVGRRFGRHRYETLGGEFKSLEGSLALCASTFLCVLAALTWLPGLPPDMPRVTLALLAAVVATCVEALGIRGLDNLWVPLATGGVLAWTPAANAWGLGMGAGIALFIGVAAWARGSLSPSGVLGAILIGTPVFGLGGPAGTVALLGFFFSSSALSKMFRARKADVEAEYAKTGTRDLGQALANGGVAAVAAVLLAATGDSRYLLAMLGALAAANADTWATELGVLSRSPPRRITTLRPVPPGTSGAVSAMGLLASTAGAAFVALIALPTGLSWRLVPWLVLAGVVGSLSDSLLGATVQDVRWCEACARETERRVHRCGRPTRSLRGLGWLGNDTVNVLATVTGAALAFWA